MAQTQQAVEAPYAEPREVTSLDECYFYHSMTIPGYGLVRGPWDHREGVDAYLGNVDLQGKRVLEVGTASGFFCFESGALDYMEEDSVLEREPLERLAAGGQLHAYQHEGFWDCMDTYKDAVLLNDVWEAGGAPWKVWP